MLTAFEFLYSFALDVRRSSTSAIKIAIPLLQHKKWEQPDGIRTD
jgi:hypothetical protein